MVKKPKHIREVSAGSPLSNSWGSPKPEVAAHLTASGGTVAPLEVTLPPAPVLGEQWAERTGAPVQVPCHHPNFGIREFEAKGETGKLTELP